MHDNCLKLYSGSAKAFVSGRVLEIGPDKLPSSTLQDFTHGTSGWDTIDIDGREGLTYHTSELYSYPISDNVYDTVVAANVLEHVPMPWLWFVELARVVKPGGHIVTISPVNWPYHPHPVDCWRAYPHALLALHSYAGLQTLIAQAEGHEIVDTIAIARKSQ